MRSTNTLIAVFLCLLAGCQDSTPQNELAGVWQGTDEFGQTMKFTLTADGKLQLHVSSARQSFSKYGNYAIDLSQQPAHFDIKLQDREINTIVERIDEHHIAFESIGSGQRPRAFGEQRIVLERQ